MLHAIHIGLKSAIGENNLIVLVVGCRGGNRYVEGEPFTFGELMSDDSLGSPYYRLFNVG